MPTGNHHYFPSGFWWQATNQSTIPELIAKSCGKVALFVVVLNIFYVYRSNAHDNVYNMFNGRSVTLGKHTIATHAPASVEEIDRLKEKMYARKKAELGIL